jgi:NADH dehydrogenase FAD-containing subunit
VSEWREKFSDAQDIVIVGGGAVGAELSGEIRDEYPVCRVSAASLLGIHDRI